MKIGIVGLPNVGKSTMFNSITNAGAECANYPFCTIEPNVGVVTVPDDRMEKLKNMYEPNKFIPTAFSCVILLKNIEEIKENFELYNVFFPDGKKVNLYEELEYRKEFFAISKKTFSGNRKSAIQSIHMILRYCPFYIDFSTWG